MNDINWNKIITGIHFEGSDLQINWETPIRKLKSMGKPKVVKNGGRVEIIWGNTELLKITGDWLTYYYPHELFKRFTSIQLNYAGDKESFVAFEKIKLTLFEQLGNPILQNEQNDAKEIKWQQGRSYVYLYLFETHAYRCNLTIGIN